MSFIQDLGKSFFGAFRKTSAGPSADETEITRQNSPPDERDVEASEKALESRTRHLRSLNILAPVFLGMLQSLTESIALVIPT